MVKEHPLPLPDNMVRAILDGRKSQARSVLHMPRQPGWELGSASKPDLAMGTITSSHPKRGRFGAFIRRSIMAGSGKFEHSLIPSPFGGPGDRLWVREAHAVVPATAYRGSAGIYQQTNPDDPDDACVYRENFDRSRSFPWRSSTQMPRWASRILLEVTDIRIQRLHEITENDAIAEGARHFPDLPGTNPWGQDARWSMETPDSVDQCLGNARMAYANHFCRTHGRSYNGVLDFTPWDDNPLVWVADFRILCLSAF